LPIHVSNAEALNKSVICTSLAIHNVVNIGESWLDIALENHRKSILAGVRGHRSFGSAAINMMYCAQGSTDAYIEYGLHSWDICAGVVIYEEAGGKLFDPTGKPFNLMSRKILCASTESLAKEISSLFTHAEFEDEGEHTDN
jgi:myo-inositol-1(or 4)-monophosphatase